MSDPPKNLSGPSASTPELLVQIKAEMDRKKVSAPQLARQMRIAPRTLNHRLRSQKLTHAHASEIAAALGIPLSVLAERAEHAERTAA